MIAHIERITLVFGWFEGARFEKSRALQGVTSKGCVGNECDDKTGRTVAC